MKRIVFPLLIILMIPMVLAAQAAEAEQPERTSSPTRGFVNNLFFTTQFGGGTMGALGAGIAFLDNIVRPEVLLGYTGGDGYNGTSLSTKLNARIFALPINEQFGMYATLGTSFTFFSSDSEVASAAFLAEEFEFVDFMNVPSLSIYLEQDFYFVSTTEGNVLFQLGIGVRASLF